MLYRYREIFKKIESSEIFFDIELVEDIICNKW